MGKPIVYIIFIALLLGCISPLGADDFYSKENDVVIFKVPEDLKLKNVYLKDGKYLNVGDQVNEKDFLATFVDEKGDLISISSGVAGKIIYINKELYKKHTFVPKGSVLLKIEKLELIPYIPKAIEEFEQLEIGNLLIKFLEGTGIYAIVTDTSKNWADGIGRLIMIFVGLLLIYLGIVKEFEPLLLIPIGMGAVLSNIPLAFISNEGGILHYIFEGGIATGIFPLIIFMGVGALTDFGPMIANPKTSFLGAAAQFGIFGTLVGAILLTNIPGIEFSLKDASSIGIIGGADGPTSIFLASRLSPRLLGSIAVAAYSYMALVPIIQPPIMKWLTTPEERKIKMKQLRYVSKKEKILFPLIVILLCFLFLPSAAPLIGFLMFGNLMRECGVVERLSNTTQNALINITTIFLGLGVGTKLSADKFLTLETLGIIVLGLIAFMFGTAAGVLMAKVMNMFSKTKINPLIGSAGVSAVPMAARVSNKLGLEEDPHNFLIMHAMGPNVSGVIGSAVAAGVLLAVFA